MLARAWTVWLGFLGGACVACSEGFGASSAGSSSTAEQASSSTASGGGTGAAGGVGQGAGPEGGAGGRGGEGGTSCEGTIPCWTGPSAEHQAPCNDGDAVASCVSDEWNYCVCGIAMDLGASVFFHPPSGTGPLQRVVVVGPAVTEPYNVSFDNAYCGNKTGQCDAPSCGDGRRIYVFDDFGIWDDDGGNDPGSGQHDIKVWAKDTGSPCDEGVNQGMVIIDAQYTIP